MEVITFNALKGGTGKSTLSILTLNILTKAGFKCLAIDTDMVNHSLSFYYNKGIPFDVIQQKNIFKVFIQEPIQDNILTINDNLDLLHSDIRLSDFRSTDSFKKLKKQIQNIKDDYEYVIIDTPPTYDNIIANVFHASDYLYIPVIPDVFNYQSVKYLYNKLVDLELENLDINIIFNQYEKPRTGNKETFSNQLIDLFKNDEQINQFICPKVISKSTNIKKYINDSKFKISNRKETLKQFTEAQDFVTHALKKPVVCAEF